MLPTQLGSPLPRRSSHLPCRLRGGPDVPRGDRACGWVGLPRATRLVMRLGGKPEPTGLRAPAPSRSFSRQPSRHFWSRTLSVVQGGLWPPRLCPQRSRYGTAGTGLCDHPHVCPTWRSPARRALPADCRQGASGLAQAWFPGARDPGVRVVGARGRRERACHWWPRVVAAGRTLVWRVWCASYSARDGSRPRVTLDSAFDIREGQREHSCKRGHVSRLWGPPWLPAEPSSLLRASYIILPSRAEPI